MSPRSRGVALLAALALSGAACGSGATDPSDASTDASIACTQLLNLATVVADRQSVLSVQARNVFSIATSYAQHAASLDPGRWSRFSATVTELRVDLEGGRRTGLQEKLDIISTDCAPLTTVHQVPTT